MHSNNKVYFKNYKKKLDFFFLKEKKIEGWIIIKISIFLFIETLKKWNSIYKILSYYDSKLPPFLIYFKFSFLNYVKL